MVMTRREVLQSTSAKGIHLLDDTVEQVTVLLQYVYGNQLTPKSALYPLLKRSICQNCIIKSRCVSCGHYSSLLAISDTTMQPGCLLSRLARKLQDAAILK